MAAALFLIVSTLLIAATPISLALGKDGVHHNHEFLEPGVHLNLHHVNQLPSASDLARDEARVQFINFRRFISISKSNISTLSSTSDGTKSRSRAVYHDSTSKLGGRGSGGGVTIGLKPGGSIGIGNYFVKMGLGTPVNYYDMIVDTGSSLTWLQCKPCRVYCHPQAGPVYDPSSSRTHKYMTCDTPQCSALEAATLHPPECSRLTKRCVYEASYGDRSYSLGYLSRDALTLSSASPSILPEFVYGCGEATDTQGFFGRSSGLIGLGRNSLSMSAQLAPKYGFVFSYCLPSATPNGGGSKTGTFSIGRTSLYDYNNYTDSSLLPNLAALYAFTPMITDRDSPSLYFLRWTGMTVTGKPLAVSPLQYQKTPTIIDSGTVISRIPMTIYTPLRAAFVKAMSSRYSPAPAYSILDACYYKNPKKIAGQSHQEGGMKMLLGIPEVSLIFQGGAEMKLGPQNVVIEVENGVMCLAFAANNATGLAIIGNTQQQTFRIIYDVTNSKIGFAAGGCE